jgi:UDP:flavonoid glycosyltransferase YjiC (YdhE family)
MSFGIPLVTAGLTEDEADVNVRVAWSGVGVDLATTEPTLQALPDAIRTVLDKPNFRSRASLMADEFAEIVSSSSSKRTEAAERRQGESHRARQLLRGVQTIFTRSERLR